jgi:hypothetical protein
MADAPAMEKALNGPGLAENMHGNGGETARTIWLDIYIMYKTVYNAIRGEKEAY